MSSATAMFVLFGAGMCLNAAGFAATPAQTAGALPAGLQSALYRTIVGATASGERVARNGCARLEEQGLKACFGREAARFTAPGAQPLSLKLVAFGRGAKLAPVGTAEREIAHGRVSYRHPMLTEWWRVLPSGYEQGFTIAQRPAGAGKLTLALDASRPAQKYGDGLAWGRLRYGGLAVTDARGRHLPATLGTQGSRIAITIEDRGAKYPLTVDPLVWIEQIVRAPAADTGSSAAVVPAAATVVTAISAFGATVLLSGGTAFIGAPFTSVLGASQQGTVFVYTEGDDRTWNEDSMLTADDGAVFDQFGSALAASGSNLLIGAPGATVGGNSTQGAAYVFSDVDGVWVETQKLAAGDGAAGDEFGGAVAVSGTTAFVGARAAAVGGNDRAGAVYVFNDAAGTWSQEQKLTASDGAAGSLFGADTALEGAMALVGAPAASVDGETFRGKVYAFNEAGGVWSEAQQLTAGDGAASDQFGAALALDGALAVIGAPYADISGNVNQGKAYVFSSLGGIWSESAVLTADDGGVNDQFGSAFALVGSYALVGAQGGSGHAYLYNDTGGTWAQAMEFVAGGAGYGRAVGLEGLTALVGAPNTGAGTGGGLVIFYGDTNLELMLTAPAEVKPAAEFPNDMTLTNNAATASPPLTLLTFVPSGATYVSATTTQGDCTHGLDISCDLGQLAGNGGMVSLNITYKVTTAPSATTIETVVTVVGASPAVTAGGGTQVESQPSSGGGALGLGLLVLLGLLAGVTACCRRRAVRTES